MSDSRTVTDREIFTKCQKGDNLAWEMFVRRHHVRIYRVAYFYTGNPEEARDLAQEIFIKVYRNLENCIDADGLLPWMMTIARHAGIDYLRTKSRRPILTQDEEGFSEKASITQRNPEDEYIETSRRNLLHRAINSLSLASREIILLKEIQGLKIQEIAEVLGIPEGTVKSRSFKAKMEITEAVMALSCQRENL